MPFASNSELPESIRNALPEAAQTRWRVVFNERQSAGDDEQSAIRQAWAVISEGWEKNEEGEWVRKSDEEKAGRAIEANVAKVDEGLGLVFGWAIVSEIEGEPYFDTQDDYIPSDVAMKAVAKFMRGERTAKAMHKGERVGSVDMAFPLTPDIMKALDIESRQTGVVVAMRPDDDALLAKYRDGSFTGFSIGGRVLEEAAA